MIARRALQERVATLAQIADRLGRTPATLWAGMRRYCPADTDAAGRELK
jgi:hypothetical protein